MEVTMTTAREIMDRADAALDNRDAAALVAVYADDAVITTPDQGDIVGASAVRAYVDEFLAAFPDMRYEYGQRLESGNIAIDEGFLVGTHTGPLTLATGEIQEPTGRAIRLRSCDVAEVSGDKIVRHRFYFDQMDFLSQLDLLPAQQEAAKSMRDDTV
jgi:predicted ester cyclase